MTFILFLGLLLIDGSHVYQKYSNVDSRQECQEIALVVARQYYAEGLLADAKMICFQGTAI